jgi:formate dehydrogenase iron-sulfur subunit
VSGAAATTATSSTATSSTAGSSTAGSGCASGGSGGSGCGSGCGSGGPGPRASSAVEHVPTPIDVLLGRQHELTAVERFAARADHVGHGRHGDHGGPAIDAPGLPSGARWWQDRLPAQPPGPGQQYGFRVDLDLCTGCKACVTACHNLNGLEGDESWRRVGTLHSGDVAAPRVQTVTAACHHCVEPACLAGCPANAYEKDPITGIVHHLDDDCIGCSYCTLTCPYEVPDFRHDLGIVRKCDMCAGRLAEGEAPACVQACPTAAITIDVVDVADLLAESRSEVTGGAGPTLVPGAPVSALTVPSTRYVGSQALADDLEAADHASVHASHGHGPLAVMLVLTQVSVGAFLAAALLDLLGDGVPGAAVPVALLTGLVALGASVLHLGRPLLAWRAVLGLRHSWLSREIVAFSAFAGAATAGAATALLDLPGAGALVAIAAATGVIGVACSAQLYAVTGREWWAWEITGPRFVATMGLGGPLLVAAVAALAGHGSRPEVLEQITPLVVVAVASTVVGAVLPLLAVAPHVHRRTDTGERTWRLLTGPLRDLLVLRLALAALGGVLLPLVALSILSEPHTGTAGPGGVLVAALVLATLAELIERRLFFLASVTPRMPGMAR